MNKVYIISLVLVFLVVSVAIVEPSFEFSIYTPSTTTWSFSDNCSLTFDQDLNFTNPSQKGVSNDTSLLSYWNFDEIINSTVYDVTGNGNTGTLKGLTSSPGKYLNGLSFNGNSNTYISGNSSPFKFADQSFTVCAWVQTTVDGKTIMAQGGSVNGWAVLLNENRLYALLKNNGNTIFYAKGNTIITDGNWHFISVVFTTSTTDSALNNAILYVDGVNDTNKTARFGVFAPSISFWSIGARENSNPSLFWNGSIDDVRIYDRALSTIHLAAFYKSPYAQPDPTDFTNYYMFNDPITGNIMLINVYSTSVDVNESALVTCTCFFDDDRLYFKANNSAIINVWTNLGKPLYFTGIWNNENYTTSLTLNASFGGELDWHSGPPPYASNLSVVSVLAGNSTIFSALWQDNRSLSGGGYIFSTNNTGMWINSTWVSFNSYLCWGNVSLVLNNDVGINVGFREYANNSLNVWGDSGIHIIKTASISTQLPIVTPTPTTTLSPTLTPSPTSSTTIASPTPAPSSTFTPTITPASTNVFTTLLFVIVTFSLVVLTLFILAVKKGYLTFEIIDDCKPSEAVSETRVQTFV